MTEPTMFETVLAEQLEITDAAIKEFEGGLKELKKVRGQIMLAQSALKPGVYIIDSNNPDFEYTIECKPKRDPWDEWHPSQGIYAR